MASHEPTREELEAFIRRAGFNRGWEHLESQARRMAERACIELAELRAAQRAPSYFEARTPGEAATHIRRLADDLVAEHMAAQDWQWHSAPLAPGWWAVLRSRDGSEGIFPGAAKWDGAGWSAGLPVIAVAGPFDDESAALAWATAHDIGA